MAWTDDRFDTMDREPPLTSVFVSVLVLSWIMKNRDAKRSIAIDYSAQRQTAVSECSNADSVTHCSDATSE